LIRLLWRSRKSPRYRQRWRERFGFFDIPKHYQDGIWVHAVSVGEAVAALPIINALQAKYPDLPIVVTTMTVTGSDRVKAVLGDSVFHVYIPYDLPGPTRRFLAKVKPRLLVIMETELWPNLIYYAHRAKVPIILANARLSERSYKGYARFKSFVSKMLKQINLIAAQSQADADRFVKLGMPAERMQITGNCKFDMKVPASLFEAGEVLRQQLGASRSVWIAASTHEHEEKIILTAFSKIKQAIPHALLILVPRHPERFHEVAELCKARQFKWVSRSAGQKCSLETDIFLGDTMGEMMLFFGASDVAFVAGSLLPEYGGHNLLEPALFALPILTGPNMRNFMGITSLLKENNAVVIVHNEQELADQVIAFFHNMDLRQQFGKQAQKVVESNRGSVEKHLECVKTLLL